MFESKISRAKDYHYNIFHIKHWN